MRALNTAGTASDYYQVLGIGHDAGPEDVRAAYRAQLRRWHPDLVTGKSVDERRAATEMTARLNEAYECLSDPNRRAAYDASRRVGHTSTRDPSRLRRERKRPDRRMRHVTTIGLGGVVLPLLMLLWVLDLLPIRSPVEPQPVAAISVSVIVATIWLLGSSRLMRRPERLNRVGVLWSRLMRWAGWALVAAGVVLLGIPAGFLVITVVAATPFVGLITIALISGRADSRKK